MCGKRVAVVLGRCQQVDGAWEAGSQPKPDIIGFSSAGELIDVMMI
jgi:hypothetical protein